jgi:hypothetical protein
MEKAEMLVRGNTERMSVRSATDSCGDCIEAERAGWQDINESDVPEIGDRQCGNRCKCEFEYR